VYEDVTRTVSQTSPWIPPRTSPYAFIKNIYININKAIGSCTLFLFYTLLFISCHAKLVPQTSTPLSSGSAAVSPTRAALPETGVLNKEIKDQQGNPQLLGKCTRARLEQAPYDNWFVKNYDNYRVDSVTANRLKISFTGKRFTLFMGTWCGDSQREVPRIFKILDYCGIDSSAIQLIMVSNADSVYKQSPGHEERGMDIFRVPELIVQDQDKELGRIVESPVGSLEKDLLTLAGGEAYTPRYPGANRLMHVFREEKLEKIEKQLPELAARIRPLVRSSSELNGYARVMRTAGEARKASIIFKINALIFPDQK